VDYRLDGRLDRSVEATLYFVVAEALTNVARYAGASEVTVTAAALDGVLVVTVVDDGVGGADESHGSGLRGLADRVAVIDGSLEVHSPPGGGTRLTCRIPVSAVVSSPSQVILDRSRPVTVGASG
jgi:signal transduction histidine kinase